MATLPTLLLCSGMILLAAACLDPPEGNSIDLIVRTKGVQIYKCTSSGGHLAWTLQRAQAKLYPQHEHSSNLFGFHYFLPRPDAGGGMPTWSIQAEGSQNPTSTVTGKVIVRESGGSGNIDLLLLQATSHSGHGELSNTAYIQRRATKGGVAPNAGSCIVAGVTTAVTYESDYVFWTQQNLSASPDNDMSRPLFEFFAEGFQHYTYNGSAWDFKDANAFLSSIPGQEVVGRHYYLPQKDAKGGQPTWETFYPPSSVTGKAMKTTKVSADSIPWVDLEATSNTEAQYFFGSVTFIQRRSTRGGLAPSASTIPTPRLGEEYQSPYTAVYWFYVSN